MLRSSCFASMLCNGSVNRLLPTRIEMMENTPLIRTGIMFSSIAFPFFVGSVGVYRDRCRLRCCCFIVPVVLLDAPRIYPAIRIVPRADRLERAGRCDAGSAPKVGLGLGSRGWPQAVRVTENRLGRRHSGACCADFPQGIGLSATAGAMILAACSAAVPQQARAGPLTSVPSTAPPIGPSPNRRRPVQSPAISENTVPVVPMGDLLPGSTCTTRLRCLSSRSARSCTLLVRSLTWCSWGKSRWAGAPASAAYGTSAALGRKPSIWAVASR